jgi:hypothetical protein
VCGWKIGFLLTSSVLQYQCEGRPVLNSAGFASAAEWRNDRHHWIAGFHQSAAWTEDVERTPAPLMS